MAKAKGLYKRGNIWWLRYAGLDGKVRYESSCSCSFREAQGVLIQRKQEVIEGKTPLPRKRIRNHSFRELSEHYLTWARKQRAFKSKEGFIRQLLDTFGNCPLRTFNT
jgi:hypothetical protein